MLASKYDINTPYLSKSLRQFTLEFTITCLRFHKWNRYIAARSLGICVRTIRNHINGVKKDFPNMKIGNSLNRGKGHAFDMAEIKKMPLEAARIVFVNQVHGSLGCNRKHTAYSLGVSLPTLRSLFRSWRELDEIVDTYFNGDKDMCLLNIADFSLVDDSVHFFDNCAICSAFPTNEFRIEYADKFPSRYNRASSGAVPDRSDAF